MSQSIILKAFNNHFDEFISDIQTVFPDNKDILTAKNSISLLRKSNPKTLIALWNQHIVTKYAEKIEHGDIDFFIHKDYSDDIPSGSSSKSIMDAIDKFRQPIAEMNSEDQQKSMKYIQNLTGLTQKYFSM